MTLSCFHGSFNPEICFCRTQCNGKDQAHQTKWHFFASYRCLIAANSRSQQRVEWDYNQSVLYASRALERKLHDYVDVAFTTAQLTRP